MMCDKVVVGQREEAGHRIKNKNPTQRCGEKMRIKPAIMGVEKKMFTRNVAYNMWYTTNNMCS